MSRRRRAAALTLLAVVALVSASPAAAQIPGYAPVFGVLIDGRSGQPAPGLMVSLIHPVLGRSAPTFSNGFGQFGWSAIPMRVEPYFVEVYWNGNLIYRQPLVVAGPLQLPPIRL